MTNIHYTCNKLKPRHIIILDRISSGDICFINLCLRLFRLSKKQKALKRRAQCFVIINEWCILFVSYLLLTHKISVTISAFKRRLMWWSEVLVNPTNIDQSLKSLLTCKVSLQLENFFNEFFSLQHFYNLPILASCAFLYFEFKADWILAFINKIGAQSEEIFLFPTTNIPWCSLTCLYQLSRDLLWGQLRQFLHDWLPWSAVQLKRHFNTGVIFKNPFWCQLTYSSSRH